MTDAVVVALISGLMTLIGVIISNYVSNQKQDAIHDEKLNEITRRLDEHNGYAEKFAQNSERMATIEKDIAVIKTTLQIKEKG